MFLVIFLSSCSQLGRDKQGDNNRLSPEQEALMSQGWELDSPEGG